jgi:hypothetical protein
LIINSISLTSTLGAVMKCNILKQASIFLSFSILCFLISASPSRAEQPASDLSRQIFSAEALKTLNGYQDEKNAVPALKPAASSKNTASYDIKVALSEQFKAYLSLGDMTIRDLSGRDIGQSYNAVVGFQIILQ